MRPWRTDGGALRRRAATLPVLLSAPVSPGPPRLASEPPVVAQSRFSAEGLRRVGDYLENEVQTGKIPGAIILIQQHGKPAYYKMLGLRDLATKLPIAVDTVLRLYQCSKP